MRLIRQSRKKRYWKKLSTLATLELELNIFFTTCADQIWFELYLTYKDRAGIEIVTVFVQFIIRFSKTDDILMTFLSEKGINSIQGNVARVVAGMNGSWKKRNCETENYCVIITSPSKGKNECNFSFEIEIEVLDKSWTRSQGHFRFCGNWNCTRGKRWKRKTKLNMSVKNKSFYKETK